jgi:hypothetical protein
MALYDDIIAVYPELTITPEKDEFAFGSIELHDDGDGIQYIAKWNYSKPIPEGMKLGK